VAETLIDDGPKPVTLTVRLRETLQAMVVGGLLAGLLLGGLLDAIDALIRKEAAVVAYKLRHRGDKSRTK
jgi:hypothetical protein